MLYKYLLHHCILLYDVEAKVKKKYKYLIIFLSFKWLHIVAVAERF